MRSEKEKNKEKKKKGDFFHQKKKMPRQCRDHKGSIPPKKKDCGHPEDIFVNANLDKHIYKNYSQCYTQFIHSIFSRETIQE